MKSTITFSVFADLHWREGDWTWCERRLDDIFARALREGAEFTIHCGDFCHDVVAAREMLAKYSAAPLPAYHVLGNHEFECSDSLEEVLSAMGLARNFYSFDVRGFRFVALDTNYHPGPDGALKHYADESAWSKCHQDSMVLPPEQTDFLEEALATATGPVCVFAHASPLRPPEAGGIVNGLEIVHVMERARAGRPVMWFAGHYHRNALVVRDGMAFMEVNSASSEWTIEEHHAYPPELMAKCHVANHTLINAEPVHAIVRMDMDGAVEIEGMRGAPYLGVTLESLGMDAFGRHGFPFTFNVLSAKFTL